MPSGAILQNDQPQHENKTQYPNRRIQPEKPNQFALRLAQSSLSSREQQYCLQLRTLSAHTDTRSERSACMPAQEKEAHIIINININNTIMSDSLAECIKQPSSHLDKQIP